MHRLAPSYMHIYLPFTWGFKVFLLALIVKCVQMKRRAMHVYIIIIIHNCARSQDKGLIWIHAGSIYIGMGKMKTGTFLQY